ncbi:unnamed protein product [Blepharisma stoltei]|uniref:Tyrosine specific protein phosphatases domain-containing protein n=1 Tax=Blepharisma stoltei TaxID=1481888 RepID=A0AAU9JFF6_9CILI|nr:unnamed protein product [Blepharisma stoltei]
MARPKGVPESVEYISLPFYPLLSGGITAFHRPSIRGISILAQSTPCTTVFTLQSEHECPHEIEKACLDHGLKWVWICLQGANKKLLEGNKASTAIRSGLLDARKRLDKGEFLYIHCAAGIHRTGLFIYALIRICGYSKQETLNIVKSIRVATYEKCGSMRFDLGEGIAINILNGTVGKQIEGLESLKSEEFIESPFMWIKLIPTHQEMIRFECILTDKELNRYVLGSVVSLKINFKYLLKELGEKWMQARDVLYSPEQNSKSFKPYLRELTDFCIETFGKSKAQLIGKDVYIEKQFIDKFWQPLNDHLWEEPINLTSIEIALGLESNVNTSLVEDILYFRHIKDTYFI